MLNTTEGFTERANAWWSRQIKVNSFCYCPLKLTTDVMLLAAPEKSVSREKVAISTQVKPIIIIHVHHVAQTTERTRPSVANG